jgi:hypothetical protein
VSARSPTLALRLNPLQHVPRSVVADHDLYKPIPIRESLVIQIASAPTDTTKRAPDRSSVNS